MKTISEITLYDLMAENIDVIMIPNNKFGFDFLLEDEHGNNLVHEDGLHPYAADSFAAFCKNYLYEYEKAKKVRK